MDEKLKAVWDGFYHQQRREYRDFQLVFTALAFHFVIPGLGYLLYPDMTVESFLWLNQALGGAEYLIPENSLLWRVLAGANVLTLGFLCFFLQADIKRHWPAMYPLLFMKGVTALSFLVVWLFKSGCPAFLAIAAWDALNCMAFVYFGFTARQAAEQDEAVLVPRPLGYHGE
ncbi:MAG: hypothetical protein HY927_14250 [Elusimicrobia bacterium]|nr:hypothetical protein [Elusimicrobiota bacterium]